MIRVKGCQRCGGDMFWEGDLVDSHWTCLQCGRIAYSGVPVSAPRSLPQDMDRTVARGRSLSAEVLVAGEEADDKLDLALHLDLLGLRPVVASTWEEAWLLLNERRYPLIFLDGQGTNISALASAKRIKRLWPTSRLVLVVEWGSDDEELLLGTVDLVVHKPLNVVELRQAVEIMAQQEASVFTSAA